MFYFHKNIDFMLTVLIIFCNFKVTKQRSEFQTASETFS